MFNKKFSDKSGFALPIAIGALVFFIIIIGVWAALNLSLFKTSSAQTSSIQALSACEEGISYAVNQLDSNPSYVGGIYTSKEGISVALAITTSSPKAITATVNAPVKRSVRVLIQGSGNVIPGPVISNGNIRINGANNQLDSGNPNIPGALYTGSVTNHGGATINGNPQQITSFNAYSTAVTSALSNIVKANQILPTPSIPTGYTSEPLTAACTGGTLTGNYVITDTNANNSCSITVNGNLILQNGINTNSNSSITVNGGSLWIPGSVNTNGFTSISVNNGNLITNNQLNLNGSISVTNGNYWSGSGITLNTNGSSLNINKGSLYLTQGNLIPNQSSDPINISGNIILNSGNLTLNSSSNINGNILLYGSGATIIVDSSSTVNGNIYITNGDLTLNGKSTLNVGFLYLGSGSVNADGSINANSNGNNGNMILDGGCTINGFVYTDGQFISNGHDTINGALWSNNYNNSNNQITLDGNDSIIYNQNNLASASNILSQYLVTNVSIIPGSWHEISM